MPGVVRYVQNPVLTAVSLAGVDAAPPWVDVFSAIWFEDRDAYLAATKSPQWAAAGAAAAEIFDADWVAGGWAAEIEERIKREGLGAPGDGVGTPPTGRSSWSGSSATAPTWTVTNATGIGRRRTATSR